MAHWFRMYESILDDPKVQKLPPKYFKAWVNLLCLASKNGGFFPNDDDWAFALRISQAEVNDIYSYLGDRGFFDVDDDGRVTPHNWASRQYKSDGSAERMRRHRDKQRNVTSGNGDVTVTPSESEPDTEPDSEPVCVTPSPVAATATHTAEKAKRVPLDWMPSEADIAQLRKGRPDLVGAWYDEQMEEFRDWCRKTAATSFDFSATWRGFMRKAKAPPEARTYARKPGEPVPFMGTAEPWEQRLRGYRPGATWWKETDWGPRPETGRCRAPKELVERYLGSAA